MKNNFKNLILFITLILSASNAFAQTSSFTYQGKLSDGGMPPTAQYDFTFKLYDSVGTQIGTDVLSADVQVTAGVFTVNLNFGTSAFTTGAEHFLEIAVRPGASTGGYTALTPRQPITSSPFSIRTQSATSADGLSAVCNPCVTNGQIVAIDGLKVTGTVNNATTAVIAGNVSGVVGIENGGTNSSVKNFVDLTTNQRRIVGDKEFLGTVAVTGETGFFTGNGSRLTNLNGANLTDGSITTPKIADGSVTKAKLAYGSTSRYDPQLVATLRWDLMVEIRRDFPAGNNPFAIAFDGENMWISNYSHGTVTKLRASDGVCVGTCTFPVGDNPRAIAYDGANMWVLNNGSNNVTKLRASDGENLGTYAVGTNPRGIIFDGANIWTVNQGSDNVTKLRASDGDIRGTFQVMSSPRAIAFDGANLWVGSLGNGSPFDNIRKLRTSDGAPLLTTNSCRTPVEMAFDGTRILVTCSGSTIYNSAIIRVSNGSSGDPIPSGVTAPSGVAFDGLSVWIVGSTENCVAKQNTPIVCIPVGNSPRGVAFDGTSIWVTNFDSNTVTKLTAFP